MRCFYCWRVYYDHECAECPGQYVKAGDGGGVGVGGSLILAAAERDGLVQVAEELGDEPAKDCGLTVGTAGVANRKAILGKKNRQVCAL